jgi:alpha-galactosidase
MKPNALPLSLNLVATLLLLGPRLAAEEVGLQTLDLTKMAQGWGTPQTNRGIRGEALKLAGREFATGVGTHAESALWVELAGGSERFRATVGVDDNANGPASLAFKVIADGRLLWESGVMRTGTPPKEVNVDLRNAKTLLLLVEDAGDGNSYDHANWAAASFTVSGARPQAVAVPREEAIILTPKPGLAPRINGPKVYGVRPGNPFLYRIPCQGQRPLRFSAEGLPGSLQLDAITGIITGVNPPRGEYRVTLSAANARGTNARPFKIISGDTLALTPPMGWNHWYAHYDRVTDKMMREAADVMVRSGMADVGYQYVNIDDCWMNAARHKDPLRVGPLRDPQGNLVPNQHFPDLRAITDYIHKLGLKAGTYTSPGPTTCAGFAGTYQHEAQDARQFAAWGFDFVKYDWCSYGRIADGDTSRAALMKPYQVMGDLLKQQPRDIVFNLCQYGMGNVWEWGADVGGHCWRTAGDLGFELNRIFEIALANTAHRAWSRPGAWNDPDYIQIGHIGNAQAMGEPKPGPLSPNEQYAFMSLWCLMAAPLVYSGDMATLDDFTLNVLCNPEVIEINQDPLGQAAALASLDDQRFLLVKDLEDGGKAVGLCNRGQFPTEITAPWAALGVSGKQTVRDLWRQQDLGVFTGEVKATVPRRAVLLLRVSPAS